jgi:putative chitobiose transport system substrate-binding protein
LAPRFNGFLGQTIREWEGSHPSTRVRWTDVPWSSVERKLLAAVFARTAPDLVNLNPLFGANLASKGGLRDLGPLLPAGAADAYLPRIWKAARQDGAQIAVPWYLTVRLTFANSTLLRQAGLQAPPRRWQDVPAYAEAVRRRDARAPRVLLEASGGVRLDTVKRIAATGVDRISVGAITHSALALDLGLDLDAVTERGA